MSTKQFPFDFMKRNYLLANKNSFQGFKSGNWDAFPDSYESLIDKEEIWPRMLRNALSIGFNDNLMDISNKRFKEGNNDLWKDMKKGDFPDLLDDTKLPEGVGEKIKIKMSSLFEATEISYVLDNCLGKTGAPQVINLSINHLGKNRKFSYNNHDIDDIYHSWFILNQLRHLKSPKPVICEIGAGYGGLATKIKRNVPNSKVIIFDLPEVNVAQSYYLSQEFKEKKFLGYSDFLDKKGNLLKEEFDFLILPGWTINEVLEDDSVDSFINIRSMMEMSLEAISFYFENIHRTLKINGIFACVNRYLKPVGTKENYVHNFFKNYPFDKNWSPIYSFPSELQPHIHFLIAKREENPPIFPFTEILKTIRPNPFRFLKKVSKSKNSF